MDLIQPTKRSLNGLMNINLDSINNTPISQFTNYPIYYGFYTDSTDVSWEKTLTGTSANLVLHLDSVLDQIPSDYIIHFFGNVSFSNYGSTEADIRRTVAYIVVNSTTVNYSSEGISNLDIGIEYSSVSLNYMAEKSTIGIDGIKVYIDDNLLADPHVFFKYNFTLMAFKGKGGDYALGPADVSI